MDMTFILYSIGVFLTIVLILVIILLVAKKYLSPSGQVTVTINVYFGSTECVPSISLWW